VTPRPIGLLLALAAATRFAPGAGAQTPAAGPCDRLAACSDGPTMLVTVTEFRPGGSAGARMVAATIRFLNKTPRPLSLGYVDNSGVALDERGNRFVVGAGGIQGIGLISASSFDPKLTIQPGESSDGIFQFTWRPAANQTGGSSWDIELVIREIDRLAGNQFKLGKEHVLQFRGFREGWVPTASPGPPPRRTPP
jgi:hypothetical protein